jgi:hypothetical protein
MVEEQRCPESGANEAVGDCPRSSRGFRRPGRRFGKVT